MSIEVSRHIEGYYEIRLARPEEAWVKLLAEKMLCEDLAVLSMAVGHGLIELMMVFDQPEHQEVVPESEEVTNEEVP
jgi:hypothetical protein